MTMFNFNLHKNYEAFGSKTSFKRIARWIVYAILVVVLTTSKVTWLERDGKFDGNDVFVI